MEFDNSVVPYKFKRYVSCPTPESLRKLVKSKGLVAVHVGATFDDDASRARGNSMRVSTVGKPLVFDLDLQDIPITNVDKKDMSANDRWVPAVFGVARVLKAALEQIFGYEHFLCVYSGRRGCHLWVLDERAFHLTDEARRAITEMLRGTPYKKEPRLLAPYHNIVNNPSFEAALEMHNTVWYDTILRPRSKGGVGVLDTDADIEKFLDILFTPNLSGYGWPTSKVDAVKNANAQDLSRVKLLVNGKRGGDAFETIINALNIHIRKRLDTIKFTYCWPCIDVDASSKRDHLTKVPFSMHGSSGRIAVPIDLNVSEEGGAPPRVPRLLAKKLIENDSDTVAKFRAYVTAACAALDLASPAAEAMDTSDGSEGVGTNDIEDLVTPPKRPRQD
jgi:DNA primase small subunit